MTLAVPSATCRAPHVGLRFSPDGHAHACCVNHRYPLGHVANDSLQDIWRGAALLRLRDALDVGDYSRGCQDCETEHRLGARLQTHAEAYDRFPQPEVPLAWPKRVEFALSNTCNLQCVHCNGDLSSAIRAQREHRAPLPSSYGDQFFAQLRELLPHVEVAVFIGGEPFLAREARRVWDLMIELDVRPEVHVTTNGTVWDERVEHYLRTLRMNVAVSVDGATAATNDAIRQGSDFGEVVANRDRFLATTRSYGGAFTLNHCLLEQNWRELCAVLQEGDDLDVPVHVIPVMYPSAMSLFTLPTDDLAAVVEDLEATPGAHRLGRNRGSWNGALAHVRAELLRREAKGPGPGQAVVLSVRPRRPVASEDVAAVRGELETWAGQPPLALRSEFGVLRSVEVPAWAVGLGLEALVGRDMGEVEAHVESRMGPTVREHVDETEERYLALRATRRVGGRDVDFRIAVLEGWGVLTATRAAPDELLTTAS